ncbi:unnamed protein product [Paramecium primaurelia]|uniref:Uncharacterized protein n=1 Tax=Paramecium primaurelia TaxID=5886 RepID=A0A8S1K2Y8_PARPR|nr:unnamed protein product [Paramecium primaurelia]
MSKTTQYSRNSKNKIKEAIQQISQCISTKSYQSANKLLEEKKRSASLANQSYSNNSKSNKKDNNKCFSVNLDFLETLTIENPTVQELLKQLNIDDQNIDIKQIIRENQDYFHHLQKNCACFKCACCNCKCNYVNNAKLVYKSGYNTSYKKSYQFGLTSSSFYTPELNLRYYEQRPIQTPFLEMQTQQRKAFTAHPIQQRYKRQYKKNSASRQFLSTTTYQKMYPDWKDHDPNKKIDAPQHISTHSGIPILTVTSYNKDFTKNRPKTSILSASDVKQMQHHQTYAHITPNYFETTYNSDFQKHHQNNFINSKTEPNIEVYVPLRGLSYDTVNKKAFQNGHIITECQGTKMKKILKLRNQSASMLNAYLNEIYQKQ